MNNNCPACGALYNVAEKDIGRKLKCKKCNAALKVTEEGLVVDGGTGSSPPTSDPKPAPAAAEIGDDEELDDDEPRSKKKKKDKDRDRDRDRDQDRRERGPGVNPLAALGAIGGIPTILFAFGVFLVIVFTALPIIGVAATERSNAYVEKLELDMKVKIDGLVPKGKKMADLSDSEKNKIVDDSKKIQEDYEKRMSDAKVDAAGTRISNKRDVWMEQYGLMFGFLFVSFGCIGYLRTEQPLVLRIVAGSILFFMMAILFMKFGGCGGSGPLKG